MGHSPLFQARSLAPEGGLSVSFDYFCADGTLYTMCSMKNRLSRGNGLIRMQGCNKGHGVMGPGTKQRAARTGEGISGKWTRLQTPLSLP